MALMLAMKPGTEYVDILSEVGSTLTYFFPPILQSVTKGALAVLSLIKKEISFAAIMII